MQTPIPLPNPFWQRHPPPPTEEAKGIFLSLHRNVYRAFDYTSESEIYDTLARSIDGLLLQWIYNEIYQSLILREEGGAVCRISSVKTEDLQLLNTLTTEKESAAFSVRCTWRVRGVVHHWGHMHARTNRYRADFTMAPRAGSWKIIDMDILHQTRVDDGPSTDLFPIPTGGRGP